jgi:hypothetical protein
MIKIRNCNSFTHEFSTASGAMDATEIVATSGQRVVVSSIFSSFSFTTGNRALAAGPIANVPRIHLTDSDDNVVFGLVPFRNQQILGFSPANGVNDSMFFQVPGRGLFLGNGLKVNALAPAPASGGMRLTLNLVYQT